MNRIRRIRRATGILALAGLRLVFAAAFRVRSRFACHHRVTTAGWCSRHPGAHHRHWQHARLADHAHC